jgi:hypothetical protein
MEHGIIIETSTGGTVLSDVRSGKIGSSDNDLRDNRTNDSDHRASAWAASTRAPTPSLEQLLGERVVRVDLAHFSAGASGDPSSAAFSNTPKGNVATANEMSGFAVFAIRAPT